MELKGIFGLVKSSYQWLEGAFFGNNEKTNEPETEEAVESKSPASLKKKKNKQQKYVVVIGFVRTGKSSLCRALGKKVNQTEQYGKYCHHPTIDDCFDFYEVSDLNVTLIDTPGIRDESAEDSETLEKLSKLVKSLHFCQFILTIHGQQPRLSQRHQQAIKYLTSCFGRRFFKSTVVVFNFWDWNDQAEATRKRSGETEEMKTSSVNKYLKETFNVSHEVHVMFLDNFPNLADEKQRQKLDAVKDGLHRLTCEIKEYNHYD